jgi:glycosyltransferase involved in cell wall biosynthesis
VLNNLDLTIAIPTKNEEQNLSCCLRAIGSDFAKKIVIIDSCSTDRTKDIARAFNAEVVDFEWNGQFPKKRNWFLRNCTPETNWILFLDADEYITEDFKSELRKALVNDDYVGYWLNYTVYFLSKQLKGGYPLRKLALFRVGCGEYEQINEERWSNLDMEVHEHPQLNGKVGIIKSKITHNDFRGVSHFIIKHNEYASWEAELFLRRQVFEKFSHKLTWKQNLKYYFMNSILFAPAFFFGSFFFYRGFRDGVPGFAYAVLKTCYFVQVYCKIQEIKQPSKNAKDKIKGDLIIKVSLRNSNHQMETLNYYGNQDTIIK